MDRSRTVFVGYRATIVLSFCTTEEKNQAVVTENNKTVTAVDFRDTLKNLAYFRSSGLLIF